MTRNKLIKNSYRVLSLAHTDFINEVALNRIEIYFTTEARGLLTASDKVIHSIFKSAYMYVPIIVIGWLSYHFVDLFLLLGIPICWIGAYCEREHYPWISIYVIFCIGIWIYEGFSIRQYITIFCLCLIWGWLMSLWARNVINNGLLPFMVSSNEFYDLMKGQNYFIVLLKLKYL